MGDADAAGPGTGARVSRTWLVSLAVSLVAVTAAVTLTLYWGGAFSAGASRHSSSVTLGPQPQPTSPQPDGAGPSGPVNGLSQWLDEGVVRALSPAQWATIARQNSIVVLNSWDYQLIPILKAANPNVRVYVYKDLSGIRSDDCTTTGGACGSCPPGVVDGTLLSSGMGYCWVRHYRPQWLLPSAGSGQPLQFAGYPNIWETDYGDLAYLRQWLQNVLADVRSHGWDGVEIDNALTRADSYGVARKYRTDQEVQAATYSALRYLGPQLSHANVGAVFNVGYATRFAGLWQRWLRPVGGLMQEFYLSSTAHPGAAGELWRAYQAEVSSCAALHKACWFHSGNYAGAVDLGAREYALASFLLGADARQYLAVGSPATMPFNGCRGLGAPLGPMVAAGNVVSRRYSNGIVVVNPSGVTASVALSHDYFAGDKAVSSLRLDPKSGVVLGLTSGLACE